MELADRLRKEREARARAAILHSSMPLVAAGGALAGQSAAWGDLMVKHRKWEGPFESGFEDMVTEQSRVTEAAVLRYQDAVRSGADPAETLERALATGRRAGVRNAWDLRRYVAEHGGVGRGALVYTDEAGVERGFDDEQLEALRNGRTPLADGRAIEGHHVNSVAASVEEGAKAIASARDPENIQLASRAGHQHLHNGDFGNSTQGLPNQATSLRDGEIDSDLAARVDAPTAAAELPLALGAGLVAGSIGAVVELWRLRKDPRPWAKKRVILASTFAMRGLAGAGLSVAALGVRDAVTASAAGEALAELTATSLAELGLDVSADTVENLLGGAAGLEAVFIVRAGAGAARDVLAGRSTWSQARRDHGRAVLVATGENLAFLLLGVAVDCALPDPTGVVIAVRIAWSVGKAAYKTRENVVSQAECLQARMQVARSDAIAALAPG